MRVRYFPCAAAAFVCLSACSIHPIPFDIPGYRTVDIVRKICCETAKAIDLHVVQPVLKSNASRDKKQDMLTEYLRTGIGYRFTFTITETNSSGATAGFKLPVTLGTFTLGIGGEAERERSGTRDIAVADSFGETLLEIYELSEREVEKTIKSKLPGLPPVKIKVKIKVVDLSRPKECAQEAKGENWVYPITGRIGMDETIRTFVELDKLKLLDAKQEEFEISSAEPQARRFTTYMNRNTALSLAIINDKLAIEFPTPPGNAAATLYAGKAKRPPGGGGGKTRRATGEGEGKDKDKDGEGKTKAFSDQLEFTTTVKVNTNPQIELKPVGSGLRIAEAGGTFAGERVDKHKVIIAITPAKKDETSNETTERANDAATYFSNQSDVRAFTKALSKR